MNANANAYAGYPADLIDVIVRGAERAGLPPLLLLALGLGESSLNPEAVGDGGQSYGVYQIHVPAHGGPPERWTGVGGAEAAMEEMSERWRLMYGVAGGDAAYQRDPVAFLARWWPLAQGSVQPSAQRCREVMATARPVWEAWQAAQVPEPPPEPEIPSEMSGEWLLRVGLAEALTEAVHTLLQATIAAGPALGSARSTALEVARLVDAAGGG